MAQRRKCATEFIQNDKARLATFQRRSHCILKKASELSILCDADVAVLIYADHLPHRPLVFPSEYGETLRIIKKFKANPKYVPPPKSKPNKFLNQENCRKRPNDNFRDYIRGLNADELESLLRILDAKEEEVIKKINSITQRKNAEEVNDISDPNGFFFFCGDDHESELFEHQPHGLRQPTTFSVMGKDDTPKSKSEQSTKNNSDFLNQISGHLDNHYDDKITSLNVTEMDCVAQISDAMEEDEIQPIGEKNNEMTNYLDCSESFSEEFSHPSCFNVHPTPSFYETNMDFESEFFDHQPPGFQCPVPCSYKVDGEATISEPHRLTKNITEFLDAIVPILVGKPEEVKNQSNIIKETTIKTTNGGSFSESSDWESLAAYFYDELPDTTCLFSTFENSTFDDEYESLDY